MIHPIQLLPGRTLRETRPVVSEMRTLEPAKRTEPYVAGVNKSFPKETFDSILMPGDISLSGQFQPRIALNEGEIAEAH